MIDPEHIDRLKGLLERPPESTQEWHRRVAEEVDRLEALADEGQGYSDALTEARRWPERMATFLYLLTTQEPVPVLWVLRSLYLAREGYELRPDDPLVGWSRETVAKLLDIGLREGR